RDEVGAREVRERGREPTAWARHPGELEEPAGREAELLVRAVPARVGLEHAREDEDRRARRGDREPRDAAGGVDHRGSLQEGFFAAPSASITTHGASQSSGMT